MTDQQEPRIEPDSTPFVVPRPRKWLGRYGGWIVFAMIAVLWAYLLLVQLLIWHFRSEVLLLIALGSFAVAGLFLYQMCYRLTPSDGVRPRSLLVIFAVGGLVAYVLSRLIEPVCDVVLGGTAEHQPLGYAWLATPTEELCKIAVVIVIARWLTVRNARTGLFVGGAVGFGFAAYENIEKTFLTFIDAGGALPPSTLMMINGNALLPHAAALLASNTGLRELFTPFAHPVWTALIAAAVFAAYRGNKFRVTPTVVIVFVAASVVHALWDFLPEIFDTVLVDDVSRALWLGYAVDFVFGVAGAITWNAVRRRANRSAAAEATGGLHWRPEFISPR